MSYAAVNIRDSSMHSCIVSGAAELPRRQRALELIAGWVGVSTESVATSPQVVWVRVEKGIIARPAIAAVLHELSLHAYADTRRAIILEPADTMTPEAANMLLKSIEEPPAGVRFYLLVSTIARILPTLRSRSSVLVANEDASAEDETRAVTFIESSIARRLAIIAGLTDRNEQLALLKDLLIVSRARRWFAAAEWLQQVVSVAGQSVNVRLALEAFAVSYEWSQA